MHSYTRLEKQRRYKALFATRVLKQSNGCWEWQGRLSAAGYGKFFYFTGWQLAHRVAYVWAKGRWTLPKSFVCHSCDNPKCVNPAHLWLGDHKSNGQDAARKGRLRVQTDPLRGEACGASKLTAAQVQEIRKAYDAGAIKYQLARQYGVSPTSITRILTGVTWSSLLREVA